MNKSPDGSLFWRLWWRAISVKRSQAALALGSLMVGAAITSMLLNLYGDVRRKMTEDFRAYGANVVVAPPSSGATGSGKGETMPQQTAVEAVGDFARQAPGMVFAPILYGVVRVSPATTRSRLPESINAVAAGADFPALRHLNPGWQFGGETVLAEGACQVGASLAARMHLRPGDSIHLRRVASDASDSQGATCRIAGILTTGASEDDQVFLPLATLQSLLGMPDQISLIEASIPGETHEVESAVRRLAGLLPGLDVRPIRQIVYSEGKVLGTIRWLLLSLTILILVIIAVCVTATMTAIVLERRKDIGVMKALGAADALLMRLFITEGAGLGLAGGVLGYAVGAWLAHHLAFRLFGVSLALHLWTLPAVCGLTVALAVIAAQIPVRVVRAIQPTVVLKGE